MFKKLSILTASLAASLVLAGGLALAGFGTRTPAADMQAVDQVVIPADVQPAAQTPQVQVDATDLAPQAAPDDTTGGAVKEATRHHDDDDDGGHEDDEGSDD